MKILYAVMGEPFSIGADHFIITLLPEFSVETVAGASGVWAQSNVMVSENAL
jgi:hypothetical protein